jgi:glucose/arabinose dehydrogenase
MRQLILGVVLATGCMTAPSPQPLRLELVEGMGQTGVVGRPLATPIVIRLVRGSDVVPGAVVRFSVASGSGSTESDQVLTDDAGAARPGAWTLGTSAGMQSMLITADDAAPLAVTAEASPDVGINVVDFDGNNQSAPVGELLPVSPAKRITDTYGNPVPNLVVQWEIIEGNGQTVGPSSVATDSNGISRVGGWRMGSAAGANRLVARMPGLPQTTFLATALAVGMPSMSAEAGDQQTAHANTPVAVAPAVRVRNAQGQGMVGVMVTFAVTSGGGMITGATQTTDAMGIARLGQWRLGPQGGPQTLSATAPGLAPLTFRATALATGAPMLTRTVHVSSLSVPWDMAFAPDGTMLFTERRGDIRVLRPQANAATLLHRPSDVDASGQSGMMGIAVDPDFAVTRHIFVYFSSRVNASTVDNRIVRFTVADDWGSVSNRQDLLVGISWGNGGAHSGGRLRFGPDGLLYLTTGDTRSATVPQDPNALGSKVLRIRKDGGTPAGNMTAPFRPSIWAYGFRNPQGIAFRPQNGGVFTCEHGPGNDDEVTQVVAQGNAGWDPKNPNNPNDATYWGYMGTAMTNLTKFPSAMRPTWRDPNSGGMSGCDFLVGAQWRDWSGALAVASLGDRNVRILRLSPDGSSVMGQPETIFGGMERIRAVVQGPDGALYLSTDGRSGGDQIWKVTAQ